MASQGASAWRLAQRSPASRVPGGGALSRRYFPVSSPLARGKYGRSPTPNRSHAGTRSASTPRLSQRVLVLGADERAEVRGTGDPGRVGDLPPGEVGGAQVADLAGPDQVVQHGQGLLDRGQRVRLVHLVEVDVVGAQPAQGRFHRPYHVAPAAPGTPVRPVGAVHVAAELGGDQDVRTPAVGLQRGAEELLGAALVAVDVRGVEQRDAVIDGRVYHRSGPGGVDLAAEVVAADTHDRDGKARGAEPAVAHVSHAGSLSGLL